MSCLVISDGSQFEEILEDNFANQYFILESFVVQFIDVGRVCEIAKNTIIGGLDWRKIQIIIILCKFHFLMEVTWRCLQKWPQDGRSCLKLCQMILFSMRCCHLYYETFRCIGTYDPDWSASKIKTKWSKTSWFKSRHWLGTTYYPVNVSKTFWDL